MLYRCVLRGTLGFAMLRCCSVFLCGIPVNKIPHCGVAVISNPTVCDVCAFKPTVFGETKLFAVLRHRQFTCRPCAMDGIYDFVLCFKLFVLAKYCITCGRFPCSQKAILAMLIMAI